MDNLIAEEEKTKYFIDVEWYEHQGRSFQVTAQARLCQSCQQKLGTEVQERVPTIDPGSGRVVFEMRDVPFAQNPMPVIRNCCSKEAGYITPETPIMEALFRAFLATSNQPMDVERIREDLASYMSLCERPHNYAAELIEQLIADDEYYGLCAFRLPAE